MPQVGVEAAYEISPPPSPRLSVMCELETLNVISGSMQPTALEASVCNAREATRRERMITFELCAELMGVEIAPDALDVVALQRQTWGGLPLSWTAEKNDAGQCVTIFSNGAALDVAGFQGQNDIECRDLIARTFNVREDVGILKRADKKNTQEVLKDVKELANLDVVKIVRIQNVRLFEEQRNFSEANKMPMKKEVYYGGGNVKYIASKGFDKEFKTVRSDGSYICTSCNIFKALLYADPCKTNLHQSIVVASLACHTQTGADGGVLRTLHKEQLCPTYIMQVRFAVENEQPREMWDVVQAYNPAIWKMLTWAGPATSLGRGKRNRYKTSKAASFAPEGGRAPLAKRGCDGMHAICAGSGVVTKTARSGQAVLW